MLAIRAILRKTLGKPVRLPADLWKDFTESNSSVPYLAACLGKYSVLYVSPKFENIIGYACEKFTAEGVPFWFSVIHPADMQAVAGSITKAQHELLMTNPRPTAPLKLEYRVTRRDGRTIWIREFKQIVSYQDGKKNHILGCLHDITAEKDAERTAVTGLLKREKAANELLNVAVSYQLNDAAAGQLLMPAAERVRRFRAQARAENWSSQITSNRRRLKYQTTNLLISKRDHCPL